MIIPLLAISFAFFYPVNALLDNIEASNQITESIFDLMFIMIPIVVYFNFKSTVYTIVLYFKPGEKVTDSTYARFCFLAFKPFVLSLAIWFCVRAYQFTGDFFFIIYLIFDVIFFLLIGFFLLFYSRARARCNDLICYITLYIICLLDFFVHLAFYCMAVQYNYVDKSTYLFILIPSIFAFIVGVIIFSFKNLTLIRGINISSITKEERIKIIISSAVPICTCGIITHLFFCSIVGPSVLWIKVYLTLVLLEYSIIQRDLKRSLTELDDLESQS